jgi:hypothetical protein
MTLELNTAGPPHVTSTAVPSPKRLIIDETVRLCRCVYRDRVRSIILTGSVARDEGTVVDTESGRTLLGDAEFFLLFKDGTPLPPEADLQLIGARIQHALKHQGLAAKVSVDAVHGDYLRGIQPSIFGYELRTRGVVAFGDQEVLGLVPDFGAADIPLEDGWRLLANRLVEQLEGFDELVSHTPTVSRDVHYRTVKLYLDMGTSLLVFAGGYAPTYTERVDALRQLQAQKPELPIRLDAFVDDVVSATRWKLGGCAAPPSTPRAFWERALGYAERLWRWELSRLTGLDADGPSDGLLRAWSARQPLRSRLRGWAYVARRHGWSRSLPYGPRWLWAARRSSPRHLVYGAAASLMFAMDGPEPAHRDVSGMRQHLPLVASSGRSDDARQLARDVLDNYHQFLVGTRA